MSLPLNERCKNLLVELGLMAADDALDVEPLTGGVASDIAKVSVNGTDYCVKFALPKLRVAADWFAPVERNLAEFKWLEAVEGIIPGGALHLYGHSRIENGFAMSFLSGDDTSLFKAVLLEGGGTPQQAAAVGEHLGLIHQASAKEGFDTAPFHNQDDFYALRIEPYLIHTAKSHPELKEAFHEVADQLYHARAILVHGDVSPKNILFQSQRPYILDAECATMGDASFDLGFCLNHFILKAIHMPSCATLYLSLCLSFWHAYAPYVSWEKTSDLDSRVTRLLPMLMMGRVDGKSPVEYLSPEAQDIVRALAKPLIAEPAPHLAALLSFIETEITT